jgi:hypothetical protein
MALSRACLPLLVCLVLPFSLAGQDQSAKPESKPAFDIHGDGLPPLARGRPVCGRTSSAHCPPPVAKDRRAGSAALAGPCCQGVASF